jgi:5-methylcytosine-specific restriction endonuclease McrA
MTVRFIAPTKRKKISQKEAARLFLLHNGICANCGQQIRGRDWFIEHVDALVLGGAETDDNRRPAHVKCKAKKDASDAVARSKRDRMLTKGWQRESSPKRKLGTGNHQHSATRPIIRWMDRQEEAEHDDR